ncbi:hypothetical protein EV426DRAFT_92140 [Tirmania nivea]|nr:hypothetical protein EV426DRAFT_92140 [Tirmania nivea]
MEPFEYHDIRVDFGAIKEEPLAPYVTRTWLADRLNEAPPTHRIRSFFDRKRPPGMSQSAQTALLLCGYFHEQAFRTLREGVASQTDLALVVEEASTCMRSALEEFYKIQHSDDLNHCLTDFESLMKTACLFLSMYTSRADWAAQCFRILKGRRLGLKEVKWIPIQDDLEDADKALRLVMSGCEKAMERIKRKEKCSKQEERARHSAQKEAQGMPLQLPSIHPFPAETHFSYSIWPASAVTLLDHEFGSSPGEYYSTPSPTYMAAVCESSVAKPVPPQFTYPNMVPWLNKATKRHRGEDDFEFQRPLQRRRESSPSFFWTQEQSLLQNDARNLPLMTVISPRTPHLDPSSPQALMISGWYQGEEVVDLTPRDGFNTTDYLMSFYHSRQAHSDT